MRIALAFLIALAAAGCAKKSPATAPATPAAAPAAESAAPDENKEAPDQAPTGGTQSTGDPCDGGETKAKN